MKFARSNNYSSNRGTWAPSDSMVLCYCVLWDHKAPTMIHKFDRLNQTLSEISHFGGLEIISNTEVWDVRTFHLLRTVQQLDQCWVLFNVEVSVLFSVMFDEEDETRFDMSFKIFEANDYSLIGTVATIGKYDGQQETVTPTILQPDD